MVEAREDTRLEALRALLAQLESNAFWAPRLRAAGVEGDVPSLEHFSASLPLVDKAELVEDQRAHPPYGRNLTFSIERYTRIHQTSGTSGAAPLRWLDTRESWQGQLETWKKVLRACGVDARDRVFFPFSFGPFLGFWTAFEAAAQLGCLALPGGGLSSRGRLSMLLDNDATVICCTPTYALRLGEVAEEAGLELRRSDGPHKLIVAGEPGGSIPAVRRRIAELWHGAAVFDHHGMTEVGPVSYPETGGNDATATDEPGVLRVDGEAFYAEVLDPESGRPVAEGELGELVLTTLKRIGSPLLRYRTGDLVRLHRARTDRPGDLGLDGGVLARTDDMVVVRGVNLYPSAFDRVIRARGEVAEYRVELRDERGMTEVRLELEPISGADEKALAKELGAQLRASFNLRIPIEIAPPGSLPRFELKARRWHRESA